MKDVVKNTNEIIKKRLLSCLTFAGIVIYEASIKEFKEKKISVLVDVESAYSLNRDDVILTIEKPEEIEEKDELEEYAKKLKL